MPFGGTPDLFRPSVAFYYADLHSPDFLSSLNLASLFYRFC